MVKMFQVGFLAQGTDERSILLGILIGAIHDRVKLGFDFEQFRKIRILGIQHLIYQGCPYKHDLYGEGDGIGFDPFSGNEPHPLPRFFDDEFARLEGCFQSIP